LNRQQSPLIYFSPVGEVLNQSLVERSGQTNGVVLLCGRYEGIDQRFIDAYVDAHISLGDFVLSGGEIAAMAWLDALARLQPGVLHDEQSHLQDSFTPALSGLLDCPHYTRPEVWQDQAVPEALLSGHHAHIAAWRRQQCLTLTAQNRPDLLEKARQSGLLTRSDEQLLTDMPKR
jgi:tRNA (guanine37-N1)-methyltransferase